MEPLVASSHALNELIETHCLCEIFGDLNNNVRRVR